ncbi:MAG: hypothetical protein ACYCWW_20685 [Deltaproteobacteria bacterium]
MRTYANAYMLEPGRCFRLVENDKNSGQPMACPNLVVVRYRRYGAPSATEGEERSFRTIAAACSRYGVVVADHVIVVG